MSQAERVRSTPRTSAPTTCPVEALGRKAGELARRYLENDRAFGAAPPARKDDLWARGQAIGGQLGAIEEAAVKERACSAAGALFHAMIVWNELGDLRAFEPDRKLDGEMLDRVKRLLRSIIGVLERLGGVSADEFGAPYYIGTQDLAAPPADQGLAPTPAMPDRFADLTVERWKALAAVEESENDEQLGDRADWAEAVTAKILTTPARTGLDLITKVEVLEQELTKEAHSGGYTDNRSLVWLASVKADVIRLEKGNGARD